MTIADAHDRDWLADTYARPRAVNPGLYTKTEATASLNVPLFTPLQISPGVTLKNRIGVAPMCMYSSIDGHASPFHFAHISSFAMHGVGVVLMEATAVTPNGRITPRDNGIWSDAHVPDLARITAFAKTTGVKIGIQLAHAGRKASTFAPFVGRGHSVAVQPGMPDDVPERAGEDEVGKRVVEHCLGFPVVGPSALAYTDELAMPHELTKEEIKAYVKAFGEAARRAHEAGMEVVEIHGAHGYLVHQFLSPLTNTRTDEYGGSFENRIRFCLEVSRAVRDNFPRDKAVFIRLSCTDFIDDRAAWDLKQTIELVRVLKGEGLIDVVHASAGGLVRDQQIPALVPGYQVQYAAAIKQALPNVLVAAVGLITDPVHANDIVDKGEADVVMLAREFIRNPAWVLQAADKLGVGRQVQRMPQYERSREKK